MEYSSKAQETAIDSSPRSNGINTNSTVCSSNNHNNNTSSGVQIPTTPKAVTPRSDSNPYPTTFVQADTSNFKHVVQMLTGSSETVKQTTPKPTTPQAHHHHHPHHHHQDPTVKSFNIPPIKTAQPKKQGFKLYERRSNNLKNSLMINTLMPNFAHHHHHHHQSPSGFSPRYPAEILSPSLLDFPSLTLSPVTPLLNDDPFDKSSSSPSTLGNSSSEEDRAIAEKGFYLHPSPRTSTNTPRDPEPRLLPLFPVTSPRVSGSSAS